MVSESVVDRSFVDRRRAELETDRRAGRLLEVVGRQRARLAARSTQPAAPTTPRLMRFVSATRGYLPCTSDLNARVRAGAIARGGPHSRPSKPRP